MWISCEESSVDLRIRVVGRVYGFDLFWSHVIIHAVRSTRTCCWMAKNSRVWLTRGQRYTVLSVKRFDGLLCVWSLEHHLKSNVLFSHHSGWHVWCRYHLFRPSQTHELLIESDQRWAYHEQNDLSKRCESLQRVNSILRQDGCRYSECLQFYSLFCRA